MRLDLLICRANLPRSFLGDFHHRIRQTFGDKFIGVMLIHQAAVGGFYLLIRRVAFQSKGLVGLCQPIGALLARLLVAKTALRP